MHGVERLVTIQFCTIVARNYVPQARVLARSLARHHPDSVLSVLVVDGEFGGVDPRREPFEVMTVPDLWGPQENFRRMAVLYDVLEYSTALKPWLLETLLRRGAESVLYLDPDIKVFAPLDDLAVLARDHDVVLTPHAVAPMPRDGLNVSESGILASGIYNLGFVGVGQSSQPFLNFWMERLERECVQDVLNMRFVDQRWVDFAPGIWDTAIVRNPTYNVAYWNLDHRHLSVQGDSYTIDGEPLHFFHFSGFRPESPHMLSRYQGTSPRILLSENAVVARLCAEYSSDLYAVGWGDFASLPYGFATSANGLRIDEFVRHAFGAGVKDADELLDEYPPDPWDRTNQTDLIEWLNEPRLVGPTVPRLSRYLASVHATRRDLQEIFPDPEGADYHRLMFWARHEVRLGLMDGRLGFGTRAARLHADGEVPEPGPARTWVAPDSLTAGIVVVGYLHAELGVGESARQQLAAVRAAGIPNATFNYSRTLSRQEHQLETDEEYDGRFDVNLVCVNADQLPAFAAEFGPAFFEGRYTVGIWSWELDEFPAAWDGSFDLVDEVWAVSQFAADAIAASTDKPVFAAPNAIARPQVPKDVTRTDLGLPDDSFLFLFCFDLLSIPERKNPLGLIEAFVDAFEPDEGPTLVVKVINGDRNVLELERLRLAAANRDDILLLDGYLSSGQQAALMGHADCYVSLHRSEGFGLTMGEAMALAKPVIATAYSANLEFMDASTGYLVDWTEATVPEGCDPYPVGARWAEPDLKAAAGAMRHVYEHQAEAREVGLRAQRHVADHHGPDSRSAFIARRFAEIQQLRSDAIRLGGPASPPTVQPAAAGLRRRLLRAAVRRLPVARRLSTLTRAVRSTNPAGPDAATTLALHADLAAERARLERSMLEHRRVVTTELEALRQTTLRRLRATDAAMQAAIEGLTEGSLSDLWRGVREISEVSLPPLSDAIIETQEAMRTLEAQLTAAPYMSPDAALVQVDERGQERIGYRRTGDCPNPDADQHYLSFEDTFRGPEPFIEERQQFYLPLLRTAEPVLDVGCGRGEMLRILGRERVRATGIDIDHGMVERCRSEGLEVVEGDVLGHLRELPPDSLGGVFSAQVVEHLEFDQLRALLQESLRVLRPGGQFVAETVNPHAISAFKTFWTDLTHKSPIFPEVLVSLCRSAGYQEAEVVWPNGGDDFSRNRITCGEYAVVARR